MNNPDLYTPAEIRNVEDCNISASVQFIKDRNQSRILEFIDRIFKDELPEFYDAVEDKEKRDERKRRLEGNGVSYYDSPPNNEKVKKVKNTSNDINHPNYLSKRQREILKTAKDNSMFRNYEALRKKKFQDFIDRQPRG